MTATAARTGRRRRRMAWFMWRHVERSAPPPQRIRPVSTHVRCRTVKVRRLLPEPGEVTVDEATTGMGLGDLAPPDRPYLVLNMVSTLDGRITIDGRSGPIGDEADKELFFALRCQADAVMVGGGTIRTERYGRLVRKPERREKRVAEGLDPDPLAIVVSSRLRLPPDLPLLQDEHSTVAVLTASPDELPETPAKVHYLRGPARMELELRPLLERLRSEFGVRSILCEGGASLNESLIREG